MRRIASFVGGAWQEGAGEGALLRDPVTGDALATASSEGIDFGAALAYARDVGGPLLRALSFAERGELLASMAAAIHACRDELIELSRVNAGSTRKDAKLDLDGATGTLSYYAKLGAGLGEASFFVDGGAERLTRSPRFVGRHVLVPLRGAAIHVNAFNFPAWGMCEKASVALLAGMPVVTKPATSTGLVAARIAEILVDAGAIPGGAFSFVAGSITGAFDAACAQDVVAFTGSARTAARIRAHPRLVAESVRVNVEADSLNAAVLGPDVDPSSETFELFVREVVQEMTQKSGQKCTAVRRIFVPAAILDAACEALGLELDAQPVGAPELREVRVGPLATSEQRDAVAAGIAELAGIGEIVRGAVGPGELHGSDGGAFQEPVLLRVDRPEDAPRVHELEVFGPVATLMPYTGEPVEAARLLALGGGSLVASVYTDDRDFAGVLTREAAPYHGRLHFGSRKVAERSPGSGLVFPQLHHGGPGRAGGGSELGGLRGLSLYLQRCALQGDDPMLAQILEGGHVLA